MAYKLTAEQREKVSSLSAEQRYEHFVDKISKWEEVWTLKDQDGAVMLSTDDAPCLPVWPHPDYAIAWKTDEWSDCELLSIPLQAWMERWLPGLGEDEIDIAVFPNVDEQGIVVDPYEMNDAILQSLEG